MEKHPEPEPEPEPARAEEEEEEEEEEKTGNTRSMGIDDGDANTASPSASATTEEKEKEKEKEKKKSPADWTKEEIREQAKKAIMGNLTKEEEEERSRRNKDLLPSDKNLGFMTIEEKYDFARKYKDAGNVFFKEGRYEFAIKNYTETITYLRHGLRMGETDENGVPYGARATGLDDEAKAIIASCCSNMAACALKLSRYEEVIKHATSALDQDIKGGAKAKVLFRRSKAKHSLGKIEEAYSDISEAKKIDEGDKAIQAHYNVVVKLYRDIKKQELEAQKTLWKGKLDNSVKKEDTAEKSSCSIL